MRLRFLFLLILILSCGHKSVTAQDRQPDKQKLQTFINLLDYVKKDYPNAVRDGKIISASEYEEMTGFGKRMQSLYTDINKQLQNEQFANLQSPIHHLNKLINQKASPDKIADTAGDIRRKVLALHLINVTPPYWPNITRGKKLFASHCTSCHGENGAGNGPLADQLEPTPTNFTDSSVATAISPLQAYNTIRLGIDGTAMRAFHELSDQEAWNIAFYVNSLGYQDSVSAAGREKIKNALSDTLSLEALATLPNEQWESFFEQHHIDNQKGMAVLRSVEQGPNSADQDLLAHAIDLLNQSAESYKSGNVERASTLALNAYLKGVEPREAQLKATDPDLVSQIENDMLAIRSTIKDGKSQQALQQHIDRATASIREAQNVLDEQDYSFWFTFIVSASILLREGLEAFLIIMVILSVLKSLDAERSIKYVHGGWIIALVLGIISWFFAESLIQMSSMNREIMEGIGSLIAVGMLLYIGFWLHNKTHASQWTKFVKEKIHRLLDDNNRWGLAILAFIVVFREAFESVIFLSSISLKTAGSNSSGILLGSLSAIIVVVLLGFAAMRMSRKIPVQALFKYSALVMAILAVILVGKGIHEFQEAGYLSIQSLPLHFNLPLLGIYPTLQTIVAQLVIIGSIIALWYYSRRLALRLD